MVTIPAADLLFTTNEVSLNNALVFESYPNRDSMQYIDLYEMKDAVSFMRGTLRYKGYPLLLRSMIELGLLAEDPIPFLSSVSNFRDLIHKAVEQKKAAGASYLKEADAKQVVENLGFSNEEAKTALKILEIVFANKQYSSTSKETLVNSARALLDAFRWLGFFSESQKVTNLI